VAGPPLRKAQRVLQQRNATRNPLPKQRSQRLRSRTRFLSSPAPESRKRNLLSNCGLRATWPRRVCRLRGRWRRFASKERINKSDPLQRQGLRPRRERSARKVGRKNWRRKGGVRDGRVTSCHLPVRGEGRSSGRSVVGRLIKSWSINNRDFDRATEAGKGSRKLEGEGKTDSRKWRATSPAGSASGYAKGLNKVPFVAAPR